MEEPSHELPYQSLLQLLLYHGVPLKCASTLYLNMSSNPQVLYFCQYLTAFSIPYSIARWRYQTQSSNLLILSGFSFVNIDSVIYSIGDACQPTTVHRTWCWAQTKILTKKKSSPGCLRCPNRLSSSVTQWRSAELESGLKPLPRGMQGLKRRSPSSEQFRTTRLPFTEKASYPCTP